MNILQIIWRELAQTVEEDDFSSEPIYDPAHVGGMIVTVIFVLGALFWLLWTLLVFGGGLFIKIGPALMVLCKQKTLADYGWVGYPYEQGIFEGFVGNLIAFVITLTLMICVWAVFFKGETNVADQESKI